MYKIIIIEDDSEIYLKLKKKVDEHSNIELYKCDKPIAENGDAICTVDDYKKFLIEYEADIYIVDWDLKFKDRNTTMIELLDWLKERKIDFHNKYWILYGRDNGNKLNEYLTENFPSTVNRETPGKNSIVEINNASGIDYFSECINRGTSFLRSMTPDWVNDLIGNDIQNIESTKETGLTYINIDQTYRPTAKDKKNNLTFYANYFIAMAIKGDSSLGLFLVLDKDTKQLKIYLFNFGRKNIKPISDSLIMAGMKRSRGIIYNLFFFDKHGMLSQRFQNYIHYRTKSIKNKYYYGSEDVQKDIITILATMRNHNLLP